MAQSSPKPRRPRETAEAKLERLTQVERELWAQGLRVAGNRRGRARAAGRAGGDGVRVDPAGQARAGRGRFQEAERKRREALLRCCSRQRTTPRPAFSRPG